MVAVRKGVRMRGRIEINTSRCKGCNLCIMVCPKDIIVAGKDFNSSGYFPAMVIDPDRCTGCSLCAEICPEVAIEVWREEPASSK